MKFLKSPYFAMFIMGLVFIVLSPFMIIQPFKEGQGNTMLIILSIVFLIFGIIITIVSIIMYKHNLKYAKKRYLPEEKMKIYKEQMMGNQTYEKKLNDYSSLIFCILFFAASLICLFIAINDNIFAIIGTIICLIVVIFVIIDWRKK